jgi:acetyltransferase-like isoleucine patch superfamily enzyme
MLTKVIRSIINSKKIIEKQINWYLNLMTFKLKKVQYGSLPVVKGRIVVINHGSIKLGTDVRFNCSPDSNMVGLFKTCTLAVTTGASLEIGDHSGFSGLSLFCSSKIKIGNYVNLGGNVCIWDTDFHPLDYLKRRAHDETVTNNKPITIGDDVFVGANSIILKGVTIGNRSIVGAGSVVSKNIPSDEIWAGNPIKFIKKIDEIQ